MIKPEIQKQRYFKKLIGITFFTLIVFFLVRDPILVFLQVQQNNIMFRFYGFKRHHYVEKYFENENLKLRYLMIGKKNDLKTSPVIVFFHGGGWFKGGVNQHYKMATYFYNLGYTCLIPEYRVRLRYKNTTALESNQDILSFIEYLVSSKKDSINLDMVFLVGTSAGGQLALASSYLTKTNKWKPKGCILFAPTLDLSLPKYSMFKNQNQLYAPYDNIDKINFPLLIFQGKKDHAVDFSTAIRFCDKIEKNGNYCHLILFENGGHQFFEYTYQNRNKFAEFMLIAKNFIQLAVKSELPSKN